MEKSRLTEEQAIEIARQEFASLGGTGVYHTECAYFNGVTWSVEIFSRLQSGDLDIPEITINDETGLVVPHHIVKAEREASEQAYQEELKAANLSIEQFVEIANEVAVRRGFKDFSISCPMLGDGFWGATIRGDHGYFTDAEILGIDCAGDFTLDLINNRVYVDDETGSVVDSPRRK